MPSSAGFVPKRQCFQKKMAPAGRSLPLAEARNSRPAGPLVRLLRRLRPDSATRARGTESKHPGQTPPRHYKYVQKIPSRVLTSADSAPIFVRRQRPVRKEPPEPAEALGPKQTKRPAARIIAAAPAARITSSATRPPPYRASPPRRQPTARRCGPCGIRTPLKLPG